MLIERIQVKGLLSFGPDGIDLPLEPLNVLIGPNGSGKSNLLQVLGLLRTAAGGHDRLVSGRDWGKLLWYGPPHVSDDAPAKATVVADVKLPDWEESLTYCLKIWPSGEPSMTMRESIGLIDESGDNMALADTGSALNRLHRRFNSIRLYNNWTFGTLASVRDGQSPPVEPFPSDEWENPGSKPVGRASRIREKRDLYDMVDSPPYEDHEWLTETAGNLPGVISRFPSDRQEKMSRYLSRFYDGAVGVRTEFRNGKASLVVGESGGRQIAAERLSDGTLRYLSLLTVLLDPDPPPLIGIEEPELGLHPDIVFELAKLLVEASERTQLVVTTHSHMLVDALTDHPTSVVACGKHEGQTWFKRVTPGVAEVWLNDNSLGRVWSMGGIGGNRW